MQLPDLPIVVTCHARKRGRQRLGLCWDELEACVREADAVRSGDGRWVVQVSGRRGRAQAIVALGEGDRFLFVVSVVPEKENQEKSRWREKKGRWSGYRKSLA